MISRTPDFTRFSFYCPEIRMKVLRPNLTLLSEQCLLLVTIIINNNNNNCNKMYLHGYLTLIKQNLFLSTI